MAQFQILDENGGLFVRCKSRGYDHIPRFSIQEYDSAHPWDTPSRRIPGSPTAHTSPDRAFTTKRFYHEMFCPRSRSAFAHLAIRILSKAEVLQWRASIVGSGDYNQSATAFQWSEGESASGTISMESPGQSSFQSSHTQTNSASSELLAQDTILLAQIVDCLLLLLIHPARDGDHHEPEGIENAHGSTLSCGIGSQLSWALFSARLSLWTVRGRALNQRRSTRKLHSFMQVEICDRHSQTERLTEDTQTPCSHAVRDLR